MGESADGADVLSTDVQRGALIGCERDREIGTFEHLGEGGGVRGAHPGGARGIEELGKRSIRDEAAPGDDDEVVGRFGHLREQMTGDEDRAPLRRQVAHEMADPRHALRVEPVDRFVEDEDFWVPDERRGDAEALAHAQGERPDAGAADVFEPDRGQAMIDSSGSDAVAAGHAEKMAACRLARMAGARFEKRADCAQGPDQPRIGAAVDERSTRARMVEAEQHPHRRRLPCSVRAEESSDLAGPDGQADVIDGASVTVLLGE